MKTNLKRLKLFPKTFFYTFGMMLLVVLIAHTLIYLLAPKIGISLSTPENTTGTLELSIREEKIIMQAIQNALPLSLVCCMLISVLCSFIFSKMIANPIKTISAATERMMELDHEANCPIHAEDEIGILAQNVNYLYANLLTTIEHLEHEKDVIQDMEQAKIDFLRAASHELKTPVTALSATLENMILGVGKYQDYAAYLPECKEMVEHLSEMIHEILETSKLNIATEQPKSVNVSELIAELCEPYQLIASAYQISFSVELPEQFPAMLRVKLFRKAISNILSNAVAYTEAGKAVYVYADGRSLIIENKCVPIPDSEIQRLFEPFYRSDFSRNRESGGNGLGLYIVKTFLTSMEIPYSFTPMQSPSGMRFTINL